jgi:hypothetical protein
LTVLSLPLDISQNWLLQRTLIDTDAWNCNEKIKQYSFHTECPVVKSVQKGMAQYT